MLLILNRQKIVQIFIEEVATFCFFAGFFLSLLMIFWIDKLRIIDKFIDKNLSKNRANFY